LERELRSDLELEEEQRETGLAARRGQLRCRTDRFIHQTLNVKIHSRLSYGQLIGNRLIRESISNEPKHEPTELACSFPDISGRRWTSSGQRGSTTASSCAVPSTAYVPLENGESFAAQEYLTGTLRFRRRAVGRGVQS
jgi:hypothetical protein